MLSFVDKTPVEFPYACSAKIRYRQEDQPCTIERIEKDTMYVSFHLPQRAVTMGQSIVLYQGGRCLGGGIIKETS